MRTGHGASIMTCILCSLLEAGTALFSPSVPLTYFVLLSQAAGVMLVLAAVCGFLWRIAQDSCRAEEPEVHGSTRNPRSFPVPGDKL